MHNNFYFLRQISKQLELRLKGTVVSECFTQSKEELVIRFETHTTPFFIKASLLANFSCLSFPENFQRARKNSVDLFPNLIGQRLISVRQFQNERSFALCFTNELTLLFKMHGNRSNLILFDSSGDAELFKTSLEADTTLKLEELDRTIDWSKENFIANHDKLKSVYFTFGKIVWHKLEENGFSKQSIEEQWKEIQDIIKALESPAYYITEIDNTPALSLLHYGNVLKEHHDPLRAASDFYYIFTQTFAFTRERAEALSLLKTRLQQSESYLEKTLSKLTEVEDDSNYKVWADLIMANLHAIPPRAEKTTLANFYNNNHPVEIKLKHEYSPQKNAEIFYKKSKNQQIEINRLRKVLSDKEREAEEIKKRIASIESASDLKTLRSLVTSLEINAKKEKQKEILPYHSFEHNDYKIWVGKNAQSNDKLTLKYSFKDDLWLHAKDVSGSHVLIKHQAGKNFPKDVIERAAQLAAYFSKRKNESLCPVIVTPKKFVRKRKGDPAGTVVIEREEVILVEPKK